MKIIKNNEKLEIPIFIEKLLPKIINKKYEEKEFDPDKILNSLLEETTLNKEQAFFITKETVRRVILLNNNNKLNKITKPQIRELVRQIMIENGHNLEGMHYARLGYPFYDFKKMYENNNLAISHFNNALISIDKENTRNKVFDIMIEQYKGINHIYKKLKENGEK